MAQTDAELIRRSTTALNRGDFDAFLEEWSPDAVLDWTRSHGLEARVYRGTAEIRKFAERFREVFGEMQIELLEDPVEVQEGMFVVENLANVRGRDEITAQARSAWLITIRNGEQTSLTLYQSKADALAAAESQK